MTVQEAIEILRNSKLDFRIPGMFKMMEAIKVAEVAMKEVEQYRALGTVDGFKSALDGCNEYYNQMKEYKTKLQEYEALGTVEELKEAKEKQPKADWIPFEEKEADEDEREAYGCEYMLCCKLPDEGEEILVTYSNGCVGEDIFVRDGYECYLDSGAEIITDAIAWMPKPQPYKADHLGEVNGMVKEGAE